MHNQHMEDAHAAGADNCDPATKCFGCPDRLHGQDCQLCRDNPEPDPEEEIWRLAVWIRKSTIAIEIADSKRRRKNGDVSRPKFQAEIKEPLNLLVEDVERLLTLLYKTEGK